MDPAEHELEEIRAAVDACAWPAFAAVMLWLTKSQLEGVVVTPGD